MRHWGVQEGVTSNDFAWIKRSISSIPNYFEPKRSFSSSDMQCKRRGSEGGIPQSLIQLLIFFDSYHRWIKMQCVPRILTPWTPCRGICTIIIKIGVFWLWLDWCACTLLLSFTHNINNRLRYPYRVDGYVCKWGIVVQYYQLNKLNVFQHLTKCTTTMPHPVGFKICWSGGGIWGSVKRLL